jgi:hypothetical protein
MGLSHPRFITADVGMAAPEAVDEQASSRSSRAMMWHSIEDLKKHCCIMPDISQASPVKLCNKEITCLFCAALKQAPRFNDEAYKVAPEMTEMLQGSVDDPQSPLKHIKEGTQWQEFYIQAMLFLLNNDYVRDTLRGQGDRALPQREPYCQLLLVRQVGRVDRRGKFGVQSVQHFPYDQLDGRAGYEIARSWWPDHSFESSYSHSRIAELKFHNL